MPTEDFIQTAPDSTGKKVRNVRVPTTVDGVDVTVLQQVVALADAFGHLVEDDRAWREATLNELQRMNEFLEAIADAVGPAS